MDQDDGVRQGYAVGISLGTKDRDTIRLILDDLKIQSGSSATWKPWCFFTFIDVPKNRAEEHQLTEEEYAAIGAAVLARLLALRAAPKTEGD